MATGFRVVYTQDFDEAKGLTQLLAEFQDRAREGKAIEVSDRDLYFYTEESREVFTSNLIEKRIQVEQLTIEPLTSENVRKLRRP